MTAPQQQIIDISRILAGIRWRRRLWVSLAILGLVGGIAFAVLTPEGQPVATTRILVLHEQEDGQGTAMETDVALFQTSEVAERALEILGSDAPAASFIGSYYSEIIANNVLELTVTAPTAPEAIARSQALAEAFLAFNADRVDNVAQAEARALLDRRTEIQGDLAEVNAALAANDPRDIAGVESLSNQRATLGAQVLELGRLAEEAAIGAPRVEASQIVDAPRVTSRSLRAEIALNAAVGFVLGLGFGIPFAVVATVVKDRPVLRRDIAANLGASVIAQLPAPRRGPSRLWHRSGRTERRRVAAALVRLVRGSRTAVSFLEIGSPRAAAALAVEVVEELAVEGAVEIVDGLKGTHLRKLVKTDSDEVRIVDSAEVAAPPAAATDRERRIGVGSVGFGAIWVDLDRLGSETVLVVRAGYADVAWLHTVARQLADADIVVLGVVLVHPDPRDRTDGTLWDALHIALRGRPTARAGSNGSGQQNGSHQNGRSNGQPQIGHPARPVSGVAGWGAASGAAAGVGDTPTEKLATVRAELTVDGHPTDKLPSVAGRGGASRGGVVNVAPVVGEAAQSGGSA